jgi:hypothetical protein
MATSPFPELPPTAASHFGLCYFAAVLHLLHQLTASFGTRATVLEHFPFLAGYQGELAATGLDGLPATVAEAGWRVAVEAWEASVGGHLPLRALRQAGSLDHETITLLLTVGLIEEDARFGLVFEAAQGMPGQRRPTVALLCAWWPDTADSGGVRTRLRRLQELGLVQAVNPDAPRLEWALQTPGPIWDALRGDAAATPTPWARYRPADTFADLDDLIVADDLHPSLRRLPGVLESGKARAVVLRGPRHNGRRTVLGAIARRLRRGLLEVQGPIDAERWKLVGPLATLVDALPVAVLDLGPGETAHLPGLVGYSGPLGLVLGKQGGVTGPAIQHAITLTMEMPSALARERHWRQGLGGHPVAELNTISGRFRMTSGNIHRTAALASNQAALADRQQITLADVCQAARTLNRQALDMLATRLTPAGDWRQLAVPAETMHELADLEARCRHREALPASVGSALALGLSPGVRALFTGPSGTGKTLAARVLAAAVPMDLYRIDLSAVVNKYIGETEKNLNQLFTFAEELDVMLLLDEGDALLTQRTGVQTANDRYANLETNYLLQRLEAFEGILIVTSNAPERIDGAFRRRMDVVVDFRPPEATERWAIWQTHLPAAHTADVGLLREIAVRCALNGGQIRNAVLHAALLAVADGGTITSAHVETAVQREYRKAGGVCPLRRTGAGV